jgi:hypothetical protein
MYFPNTHAHKNLHIKFQMCKSLGNFIEDTQNDVIIINLGKVMIVWNIYITKYVNYRSYQKLLIRFEL